VVPSPAPTDLPVEAVVEEIRGALAETGRAVLQAPPGAGKTTLIPLRLLDQGWLAGRRIVMLEPRRLATRAAATRMAFLLGEPVGATVGYATRDERRVGPGTRVEVVTEGILTRRLQHDPTLPGVGLVVFDEVHERNLQTDLALALTLDVQSSLRPDLHLLAMSATLDTEGIAALLGGRSGPAPVVVSQGRQYPVELHWVDPPRRPVGRDDNAGAATAAGVVTTIVTALGTDDGGDILVFLPGAGDIRRVQAQLSAVVDGRVDVLPLFGGLSNTEQDRALAPSRPGRRRVVLATDIAETSLTVEGVGVVVDSGLVRTPRYDPSTGLTRLHTGAASRSSADQRAGRAGRQGPGVAYRLWSQADQQRRRPFPLSEMATVDLAGFVLELAVWGAQPADLAFLEPPPPAAVDEGRALLVTLGALDTSGRPTDAGRAMADLPLHPRLARMVTGAVPLGRGAVACALAALLEDRDILRGRPDEVPVDLAERAELISGAHRHHRLADRSALSGARARATRLARRAGVKPGPIDTGDCGRVLALAYPDRIAQARGGGRFRLRTGTGAWLAGSDPLAGEAFLVVAQLDADGRDSRIRLAAALVPADLETAAGAQIQISTAVVWDRARDDLRATATRSLDGLVLGTVDRKAHAGAATTEALLQHVRDTGLRALSWTDGARVLQQRVLFLRRTFGERWPDLSDVALLATIDVWLAPLLAAAVDRAGLEAVNLAAALRARLPHPLRAELDRLAPATVTIGTSRRALRIDYSTDPPSAAARLQDLFGTMVHPTIAGERVPLVLHLLSPAGRPVQVTADLPGFWAGSYVSVRKEMAGRYPKHRWPVDPAASTKS
jgi:ATP-dependent helicase HrpB